MSGLYNMSVQDIVITCSVHHILSHLHTMHSMKGCFETIPANETVSITNMTNMFINTHAMNDLLCVCVNVCLI